MSESPVMSLEELRLRLSMGRNSRPGCPYLVSHATHERMGAAIEFYEGLGIEIEHPRFSGSPSPSRSKDSPD